jgi:hypothetical protein
VSGGGLGTQSGSGSGGRTGNPFHGGSNPFHGSGNSAGVMFGTICECQSNSPEGQDDITAYFANFQSHTVLQLVMPSFDITCQYVAGVVVKDSSFDSLNVPAHTWTATAIVGSGGLNATTFYTVPGDHSYYVNGGTTSSVDSNGVTTFTFTGAAPALPIGARFDAIALWTNVPGNPIIGNVIVDGLHILPDRTDTGLMDCTLLDGPLGFKGAPNPGCDGFPNIGTGHMFCGFGS